MKKTRDRDRASRVLACCTTPKMASAVAAELGEDDSLIRPAIKRLCARERGPDSLVNVAPPGSHAGLYVRGDLVPAEKIPKPPPFKRGYKETPMLQWAVGSDLARAWGLRHPSPMNEG